MFSGARLANPALDELLNSEPQVPLDKDPVVSFDHFKQVASDVHSGVQELLLMLQEPVASSVFHCNSEGVQNMSALDCMKLMIERGLDTEHNMVAMFGEDWQTHIGGTMFRLRCTALMMVSFEEGQRSKHSIRQPSTEEQLYIDHQLKVRETLGFMFRF